MKEIKVRVDDRVVDELKKKGSVTQLVKELIAFYLANQKQLNEVINTESKLVLRRYLKVKELETIKKELQKEVDELYNQYGELSLSIDAIKLLREIESKATEWLRSLTINDVEGLDELKKRLPDFIYQINALRSETAYIMKQLDSVMRQISRRHKLLSANKKASLRQYA